jgi:hypothetical protein
MDWEAMIMEDAREIFIQIKAFKENGRDFRFSEQLYRRMAHFKLDRYKEDDVAVYRKLLVKRCSVTDTAVRNWLSAEDKPRGRERLKSIGLALEMTETEVNDLLWLMLYRPLYEKNPLDFFTCIS